MKDNQNERNMGEQIMDALTDALQSGNFTDLNRLVSQSVTTALNEVGKHIQFTVDQREPDRTNRSSPYADSGQADKGQEDSVRRQAQGQAWQQAGHQGQAWQQTQQGPGHQGQAWQQTQQGPGHQGQAWQQTQGQTWQRAQGQTQQRAEGQERHKEQTGQQAQGQDWRKGQTGQQAQRQDWRKGQTGQQTQGQDWRKEQTGQQAQGQDWRKGQTGQQAQGQDWRKGQTGQQTQGQDWRTEQTGRQGQAWRKEQAKQRAQERTRQRAQEREWRQEQARQRAQEARRQTGAYRDMPQISPAWQFPTTPNRTDTAAALPFKFKKVGNVSNVLYQVFGGIGLGVTTLITFFHLTLLLTNTTTNLAGWIVNALFLALFAGMIRLGVGQRRRLKLAKRYAGLCGHRLYGDIGHLAKSTGRKARRVIKDLQKMIKLGIFPEGHLDEQKTCFMLSDGIYRQYLETENNRKLREEEERKAAAQQADPDASEAKSGQAANLPEPESELNAMVAEGMECIRKLHVLNDKIPGEVISDKLFRMENLLKDLFDSVKEHPEQMHRMHKLMNYYLPTTLKLVEAYEEFDRVSVPGDDIIAAKAEIENTLDTINQAFTELLNNLFQDAVLDATTDAQVLKTMLAREGLMNDMINGAERFGNGGQNEQQS